MSESLDHNVERCDAEIREIQERPIVVAGLAPAWLATLGVMDWTMEREWIRSEGAGSCPGMQHDHSPRTR